MKCGAACGRGFGVGFTLIELMVTIAIVAILLTLASPDLVAFVVRSRLSSEANGIVSDVLLARSEAATRGLAVVICPSGDGATCSGSVDDWANGRIVFVDADGNGTRSASEALIRTSGALSGNPTLTPSSFLYRGLSSLENLAVGFSPYGLQYGARGTFKLCSSLATGKQIAVDMSGRPSVTAVACP